MELQDVVEAMSVQLAQMSQLHLQAHMATKAAQRRVAELEAELAALKPKEATPLKEVK